jgi:uncharacterized protein (DUF2267 family)
MMAVLHASWEWLSTDDKEALAVGLPVRLCGTQCEPWHASTMLPKSRSAEGFLARVDLWFRPDPVKCPAQAVAAVVDLLSEGIIDDRIEDMCRGLPVEFQPGSLT